MLHYSMLDYPIRMKKTPSCIKQYIRSGYQKWKGKEANIIKGIIPNPLSGYQKWKGKEGFQNTLTYS